MRALVDLLPEIDVVEGDSFNSDPFDPKLMGPDALERYRRGETLPSIKARTPLVSARAMFTILRLYWRACIASPQMLCSHVHMRCGRSPHCPICAKYPVALLVGLILCFSKISRVVARALPLCAAPC